MILKIFFMLSVSISIAALSFTFFSKTGREIGDAPAFKKNNVKSHSTTMMTLPVVLLATSGSLLSASIKTGLVISLILFLATILERHMKYSRMKIRRTVIDRKLPLLLDFLVLQIESGHSILQAFKSSCALFKENSPVYNGLMKFQEEIRLGSSVKAAIEELAAYLDTTCSEAALLTISQAIKHGTPLGEILRDQSNRMREHLLIEGEKFANTLSVKLLIPLIFFIFPASFLVIFCPVIVSLNGILQ